MKTLIVKLKQPDLSGSLRNDMYASVKMGCVLLLLILMMACSGTTRYENEKNIRQEPVDTEKQVPAPGGLSTPYYINDENNQSVGEIFLQEPVYVRWKEINLYRVKRDEKYKYRNDYNQNVYEVKPDEDGFKVRNEEGKLLWKIKYREGKVKIGNDEEMKNVYEIKRSGNGGQVMAGEKIVGVLDLGSASVPMYIKSGDQKLYIIGPDKMIWFAVLGIPEIPADQQLVIIGEILIHFP